MMAFAMDKPAVANRLLDACGIHHWLECPGSIDLAHGHENPDTEDTSLGKAAHILAAHCLRNNEVPYSLMGGVVKEGKVVQVARSRLGRIVQGRLTEGDGHLIDAAMAMSVQEYLDDVQNDADDDPACITWIEHPFHCPDIHEQFRGGCNHAVYHPNQRWLIVRDYRHGTGTMASARDNTHLMYNAVGMLHSQGLWEDVSAVTVAISQPRSAGPNGPNTHCTYSLNEIARWTVEVLIPGMERAMVSRDTNAGDHCRHCPARFGACPALVEAMDELEEMMSASRLTADQLGRRLALFELAKTINKADRETALARLKKGNEVPGWKLVNGKSNRVWKEGAQRALDMTYGTLAMKDPEYKSPAEIAKMPEGERFVRRWAFRPSPTLTIAGKIDCRRRPAEAKASANNMLERLFNRES